MRHSSVLHTAHIWKTFLWCFLALFVKRSKSNWKVVTLSELCYKCQLSWKNLATKEIGRAHFREKGVFVIPIAMRWQILVKLASVMLYEWQGGNCPNLSPGTLRLKGRLDENNPKIGLFIFWQRRPGWRVLRAPSRYWVGKLLPLELENRGCAHLHLFQLKGSGNLLCVGINTRFNLDIRLFG